MNQCLPRLLILFITLASPAAGFSADPPSWTLTSPNTQTTLMELFTSEGCSSCPPAEHWLSHWKNDTRLWKEVIPLAFHVDYWNYLGWTDRFATPAYSERQRQYAVKGYAKSVYTPGFFINGREWRGWFKNPRLKSAPAQAVGILSVTVRPHELDAVFTPAKPVEYPLRLNIAVVGFDIKTAVASGENQGKELNHDFVVLALQTLEETTLHHWRINRKQLPLSQSHVRAIVVWVNTTQDPTPVQATGGWLPVD